MTFFRGTALLPRVIASMSTRPVRVNVIASLLGSIPRTVHRVASCPMIDFRVTV